MIFVLTKIKKGSIIKHIKTFFLTIRMLKMATPSNAKQSGEDRSITSIKPYAKLPINNQHFIESERWCLNPMRRINIANKDVAIDIIWVAVIKLTPVKDMNEINWV